MMLRVENLVVHVGECEILHGINLELDKGAQGSEATALIIRGFLNVELEGLPSRGNRK